MDISSATLTNCVQKNEETNELFLSMTWTREPVDCQSITVSLNCDADPDDVAAMQSGDIFIRLAKELERAPVAHHAPISGNLGKKIQLPRVLNLIPGDALRIAIRLLEKRKFKSFASMSFVLHGEPGEMPRSPQRAGDGMLSPGADGEADAIEHAMDGLSFDRSDAPRQEPPLQFFQRPIEEKGHCDSGGFGLTRFAEMYEDKLRAAQNEVAVLKLENEELKKNRLYVLSLINFIKSSAYSIPTPPEHPDFSRESEDLPTLINPNPNPEIQRRENQHSAFVEQVLEDERSGV